MKDYECHCQLFTDCSPFEFANTAYKRLNMTQGYEYREPRHYIRSLAALLFPFLITLKMMWFCLVHPSDLYATGWTGLRGTNYNKMT